MSYSREEVIALAICEVVDCDLGRVFYDEIDAGAALSMKLGLMKRCGVSSATVDRVFRVGHCETFDAMRRIGERMVADPQHSALVTRLAGKVDEIVALHAGRPS